MPRKSERALTPATDAALSALDAMWASVDAACERAGLTTLTERPANGVTLKEFAEHRALSNRATALDQVKRMTKAGLMKRYTVLLPDERGHMTPTAVFVPVEEP